MWALKNSFLASMSTMYLNFDRRKTRLETVLHTLLICESQRSLLSMVIPKRRCSDTWSIFAPFRTRSSGKGDKWCFCLVAIVIDLVLIGLMTIWLLSHQLDTWSKLSCILLLICIISFPDVCSVVSSASMSQSTDVSFTCNGRSLIKMLKRIGSKTEPCGTPYFTGCTRQRLGEREIIDIPIATLSPPEWLLH